MNLRLQSRYALAIALLTIFITVILAVLLLYQFDSAQNRLADSNIAMTEEALIAQIKQRGEVVATTLAENLIDPFYFYDLEHVNRLLKSTLDQKDIRYAYLFDTEGMIIHDGDDDNIMFDLKTADSKSVAIVKEKGGLITQVHGDILAVSTSIWIGEDPLGGVKVGLSLEGVRDDIAMLKAKHAEITKEELGRNLRTLITTTLILIVIAVTLASIMARRLIMPIRRLSDYARQIGQQNYQVDEPEGRKDEIGDLIRSFRQMSEDLKETTISKDHYQGIIDNMNEMLLVLDPDERVVATNAAAKNFINTSPEELVDKSARTLFDAKNQARWNAWLNKLRTTNRPVPQELQLATVSGKDKFVSVSGSVMRDQNKNIRNIICVLRDITDQVKFQDNLRDEKEKAIKASRAKSEFLARMSHEIRTPMNGILGMNQLLQGTELTERQRHFAQRIEQSGQLLLDVINDVLDISKIEAGKIALARTTFNLNETIETVIDLLGESACRKKLGFGYYISPSLQRDVVGDPSRLQQILLNLIGNAIKFTEQGEVLLRVTELSGNSAKANVRFEVSDTGIGISDQDRIRIFDTFIQADGSLNREFGGTGLGLPIAKQLVKAMGGKIDLETQPGQGSKFWFDLPLEIEGGDDNVPQPYRYKNLLVIHRNATIRETICEQLVAWGLLCRAEERPELISSADEQNFDMVLAEIDTENVSEMTAVGNLSNHPECRDAVRVALIKMNQSIEAKEMQAYGIDAILQKPLTISKLLMILQQDSESIVAAKPAIEPTPAYRSDMSTHANASRVLLVEDNPVNQEVAQAMLENLGLNVDLAINGQQAVDLFTSGDYSLVLMDIQMPVMNGLEAARKIRQFEKEAESGRNRVPIIAQTAYLKDKDFVSPTSAGMDDQLEKPFNLRQLSKILDKWLPKSNEKIETAAVPAQMDLPPEKETSGPIDADAFDEIRALCENNSKISLSGMIELYINDADKMMTSVGKAIEENDFTTVRSLTHQLRSSSSIIGALNVARMASELNTLARENKLQQSQDHFSKFMEEYAEVKRLLTEELGRIN